METQWARPSLRAACCALLLAFPISVLGQSGSSSAAASDSTATSPVAAQSAPADSSGSQSNPPAQNGQPPLPNAPAAAPQEPSLGDLGITQQQMQANPALQARLDKRTRMLKIHQRLGLITTLPMVADLITGPMAKVKGRNGQPIQMPTQANVDLHAALGSATAGLYFSTAYFAIFAPGVHGTHKRGAIRMHEALAFIHGPGMILTPILGSMAFNQEQNGEKPHGIAAAHGTVAAITAISYGAAIIAVSWPIHLKFWEKK